MKEVISVFLKTLLIRMTTSFFVMHGLFCYFVLFRNSNYIIWLALSIWLLIFSYSIQSLSLLIKNDIEVDVSFLDLTKFFFNRYKKVEHSISRLLFSIIIALIILYIIKDEIDKGMMIPFAFLGFVSLYLELIFDATLREKDKE